MPPSPQRIITMAAAHIAAEFGSSHRRWLPAVESAVNLDHPGAGQVWLLIVLVSVFDFHVRFLFG
jgi:hypothetical protein